MLRSIAGDDPDRIAAVLKGLRAYQGAQRRPGRATTPVVARIGRAALHDYGGEGPAIVFVPSLINSADILDLDAERSMLRWLATQGLRPLLIDWGSPSSAEADCSIGDHVHDYLMPLLAQLGEPAILAGYCLGGTMAIAAATLRSCRGLALLAAPWHFTRYPADTRTIMLRLWEHARASARTIGLMPIEVLQSAFWQIDAERTVAKFAEFGIVAHDPAAAAKFVAVEDWANDGAPLTFAAAEDLFAAMLRDDLPGTGRWQVGGMTIDPAALAAPILEITSTTDRIVPAVAAPGAGRTIATELGHVGMIVSAQAPAKVWQPLAAWARAI